MLQASLLVVADDTHVRRLLTAFLDGQCIGVVGADSPGLALELLREQRCDGLIVDLGWASRATPRFVAEVRRSWTIDEMVIVAAAARRDDDSDRELFDAGASDVLQRPIALAALQVRLERFFAAPPPALQLVQAYQDERKRPTQPMGPLTAAQRHLIDSHHRLSRTTAAALVVEDVRG
ncbi:MAG: DNA-binding response OmpR family regulator [Flavobacteriales bacterium]|jgi:DNA-binding response OmpR family regulator